MARKSTPPVVVQPKVVLGSEQLKLGIDQLRQRIADLGMVYSIESPSSAATRSYRAHLKYPINIELIDQLGNLHKLHLDFGVPEDEGKEAQARDCLILTV